MRSCVLSASQIPGTRSALNNNSNDYYIILLIHTRTKSASSQTMILAFVLSKDEKCKVQDSVSGSPHLMPD